jgi:hypothetical protein
MGLIYERKLIIGECLNSDDGSSDLLQEGFVAYSSIYTLPRSLNFRHIGSWIRTISQNYI